MIPSQRATCCTAHHDPPYDRRPCNTSGQPRPLIFTWIDSTAAGVTGAAEERPGIEGNPCCRCHDADGLRLPRHPMEASPELQQVMELAITLMRQGLRRVALHYSPRPSCWVPDTSRHLGTRRYNIDEQEGAGMNLNPAPLTIDGDLGRIVRIGARGKAVKVTELSGRTCPTPCLGGHQEGDANVGAEDGAMDNPFDCGLELAT